MIEAPERLGGISRKAGPYRGPLQSAVVVRQDLECMAAGVGLPGEQGLPFRLFRNGCKTTVNGSHCFDESLTVEVRKDLLKTTDRLPGLDLEETGRRCVHKDANIERLPRHHVVNVP